VSKLHRCSSAIKHDRLNFGISCVKNLLEYQEIVIEHTTDIGRLKTEAALIAEASDNSDVLVVLNATILTMASGKVDTDLIRDGILVSRGGVVEYVGTIGSYFAPSGATIINARGGECLSPFNFCSTAHDIFLAGRLRNTRICRRSRTLERFRI
jgi:hypothetical protein